MSEYVLGLWGLAILLILLLVRIPVAFAMFVVGYFGIAALNGFNAANSTLASEAFTLASSPELVVIPLFILMGNIASASGMSRRLYDAAYAIKGRVQGGLASATVIGCGGFAALSGSSVASALTMGKVALAEMERFNYNTRLSTGVVAAGGTLGILIPPSTGFVIYAILTEQSIGRLFLAGILPGLLLLTLFIVTISIICWIRPEYGPKGPKTSWRQKGEAFLGAGPKLLVILLTIGGIYGGVFSPVEAAAVGAGFVILLGFISGNLSLRRLLSATRDSIVTTATVMLILIAAHVINPFLALSHIPQFIGGVISDSGLYIYDTCSDLSDLFGIGVFSGRFCHDGIKFTDFLSNYFTVRNRPHLVWCFSGSYPRDGVDLATGWNKCIYCENGGSQGAPWSNLFGCYSILDCDVGYVGYFTNIS